MGEDTCCEKIQGRLKDIWGAGRGWPGAAPSRVPCGYLGPTTPGEERQVRRPSGMCGVQGTVRTPKRLESRDATVRGRSADHVPPGPRRDSGFVPGQTRHHCRVSAESGADR